MGREFQAAVKQGESVFFARRAILKPISDDRQVKDAKSIGTEVAQIWNLARRGCFRENFANETQVPEVLFLGGKAERA